MSRCICTSSRVSRLFFRRYTSIADFDTDWVLFDPVRGFPLSLGNPPEFLQRFAHYKPGNVKALEYNLISDSIRLRVTPQILKDKVVRYDEKGPRIE